MSISDKSKPTLYRESEITKPGSECKRIFLCDSEKEADCLFDHGSEATTWHNWSKHHQEALKKFFVNRQGVILLPPNNDQGRKQAESTTTMLKVWGAKVQTIHLPDIPENAGVSEWFANRGTREKLMELVSPSIKPIPNHGPIDKPKSTNGKPVTSRAGGGIKDNTISASPVNDDDIESLPLPDPEPWPKLDSSAYHGLMGEIVRTIEPETEADPAAILIQLMTMFGNAVGRSPHFIVGAASHRPNFFTCLVGESSIGAKGSSFSLADSLLKSSSPDWHRDCIRSGLSSGEGLVSVVRDPVHKIEDGVSVTVDEGAKDKRALVFESEFGRPLRAMKRDSCTLSPVIRNLWDGRDAETLTKIPMKATNPHVSIIGHITPDELKVYLERSEMFNGFANRFLWALSRRSKLLPRGGILPPLEPMVKKLSERLRKAQTIGAMRRSNAADLFWDCLYIDLSNRHRTGLHSEVSARGIPQTLRLAMAYALVDGSSVIEEVHLRSALSVWDYCDDSARIIFGAVKGKETLADKILQKLVDAGDSGMTRTQIRDAFNRHEKSDSIVAALAELRNRGRARLEQTKTAGRPSDRWYPVFSQRTSDQSDQSDKTTKVRHEPETTPESDSPFIANVASVALVSTCKGQELHIDITEEPVEEGVIE